MKTLFLVRHAKSSWDDVTLADEDRPLNDRGKRDAPKMGKRLARRQMRVDLMLSSPARRAIKTARLIAAKLDYKRKDILVVERLYPGAVSDLLKIVRGLGNKVDRVMLVGHHPAISQLAHRFSSDIAHMPTCAVAHFEFDATKWRDVRRSVLAAASFERPRRRPPLRPDGARRR
jgi:phosphohistidine phosphatase